MAPCFLRSVWPQSKVGRPASVGPAVTPATRFGGSRVHWKAPVHQRTARGKLGSTSARRELPRAEGRRLEDEHLDGKVGVQVIVAHEADDLASGQLLDLTADISLHDALPAPPQIEHRLPF